MADTSNIREWARVNNIDLNDRGPIPKDVKEAYQARELGGDAFPAEESAPDTPFSADGIVVEGVTDRPPKVQKSDIGSRAREALKGARSRKASSGVKKRAATRGPRASVEAILTGIYGAFAGGAAKFNPAVGYIMSVQAPVAGMLLEDNVKGTAVDRLLQPFAKNADRVRVGRALFLPPALVLFMQKNPEKAAFVMPLLRKSLADYIDLAGPKIVEIQKRERDFEDKYGKEVDEILSTLVTVINAQNEATATEE